MEKFRGITIDKQPGFGSPYEDIYQYGEDFRQGKLDHFYMDIRVKCTDGQEKWLSDSAFPIRDADSGDIIASQGIMLDIDARRQAENGLNKNRAILNGVLKGIPDGILLVNANSVIYSNEAILKIYGRQDRDVRSDFWMDYILNPDKNEQLKIFQNMKSGEPVPQSTRFRIKRPDGSIRRILARILELNDTFRLKAWLLIVQDITDITEAQQENERLYTAIQQSPVTVVITNATGDISYANPAFTTSSGYSLEDAMGNNPRILKSGKMTPEFYRNLWDTLGRGEVWSGEFINKRKDGSF